MLKGLLIKFARHPHNLNGPRWPSGQRIEWTKTYVEMRGIEPRAFHMQSERSTTELHPLSTELDNKVHQSLSTILPLVGNICHEILSTAISC